MARAEAQFSFVALTKLGSGSCRIAVRLIVVNGEPFDMTVEWPYIRDLQCSSAVSGTNVATGRIRYACVLTPACE